MRELLGPLTALFGPTETLDWFTRAGVHLKVESDGRVRVLHNVPYGLISVDAGVSHYR